MVEQASPVILKDEEENNNEDTRTLAQRVEAGEVVPDDTPVTYSDDGTPTINISATPVTLQPDPKANIGDVRPSVTFKALAEKDIEKQKDVTTISLQGIIQSLKNDKTVELKNQKGSVRYTPEMLGAIERDADLQEIINNQITVDTFLKEEVKKQESPTKPSIALMTESGEVDLSSIPLYMQPDAEKYSLGRAELDRVLEPLIKTGRADIDVAVRQYFIDDFQTGNLLESLAQRVAETGRAIPTLPTYGVTSLLSFLDALNRADEMGTDFKDEWAALKEERMNNAKGTLEFIDKFIPAPTAAMALNDAIRARAKEDFENNRFSDDPEKNKLIYENFIYDTSVTGERFERDFIDDETAYAAIEAAFDALSEIEEVTVLVGENVAFTSPFSVIRSYKAAKLMKEIPEIRKRHNIPDTVKIRDIPAYIKNKNIDEKIDAELLEIGIFQQEFKKQRQEIFDTRINLTEQMGDMLRKNPDAVKSLEYKRLESQLYNLNQLSFNSSISAMVGPYTAKLMKEDAFLGLTAYSGRQLAGVLGIDADYGELTGIVGGLLFGKPIKGALKGTKNLVRNTLGGMGEGLRNPIFITTQKLLRMDLTVQDYEKLYYTPRTGKKLPARQRRSINYLFKQIEKMSPEDREAFLNQVQANLELQDNIVRQFEEGEAQDRAREVLDLAFAELTNLPQAIGAFQLAINDMSLKSLRKNGLTGAMESALEIDKQVMRQTLMMDNLEKLLIGGAASDEGREIVQDFIKKTRQSLTNLSEQVDNAFIDLEAISTRIINSAVANPTRPLDPDFFSAYNEIKDIIIERNALRSPDKFISLADEVATNRDFLMASNEALLDRLAMLRGVRNEKAFHDKWLEGTAEAVLFQRYGYLHSEMDAAYDEFRMFMKTRGEVPTMDISPFVDEILTLANADERNIKTFFSPAATFFSGFVGKQSMKMFKSMVQRTLDDLPEDQLSALISETVRESGGAFDVEDLEILMRKNPVAFGLVLHENGNLNVFKNATIEEAEEFRKAVRDYQFKTKNPAVSREYRKAKELLDKLMKEADSEGFKELSKARTKYEKFNDPLRDGTPLNKLMKSLVKGKVDPETGLVVGRITEDDGPFSAMYRGQTPYDIISQIGTNITGAINNKEGALRRVRAGLNELTHTFGEDIGGQAVIDLNKPESEQALYILQDIAEAVVFNDFFDKFIQLTPAAGQTGDFNKIKFNKSIAPALDNVASMLDVKVIPKGKEPIPQNISNHRAVDLIGIVTEEQEIFDLIAEGTEYRQMGVNVVNKLQTEAKAIFRSIEAKVKAENASLQELMNITGVQEKADVVRFYNKYIGGNSIGDIDAIRELWKSSIRKTDAYVEIGEELLDDYFDNAMTVMIYQGILDIGAYQPSAKLYTQQATKMMSEAINDRGNYSITGGRIGIGHNSRRAEQFTKKGLNGENTIVYEFGNITAALAELQNPVVLRNMQKAGISTTHTKYLHDILTYCANQKRIGIAKDLTDVGITASNAISRAYNLASSRISPQYLTTEVLVRLLSKNGTDALLLAMQDMEFARILETMLNRPNLMTSNDLKYFNKEYMTFVYNDIARNGQQEATMAYFDEYLKEKDVDREGTARQAARVLSKEGKDIIEKVTEDLLKDEPNPLINTFVGD